jgi:hypothetical protein
MLQNKMRRSVYDVCVNASDRNRTPAHKKENRIPVILIELNHVTMIIGKR